MRNFINIIENAVDQPEYSLPKYWFRGITDEALRSTSTWKAPERKIPQDIKDIVKGHIQGPLYEIYNYQFKVSRTYAGMSNWGFGVYVTNDINWASRYGNNILICQVDPEDILHIHHRDFVDHTPDTHGGKLADLLENEAGQSLSEQAAIMFKMVKKIKKNAKALFVQTSPDGEGQMCVFNKDYINAKWVFGINHDA
jgi:hypothetical protein